MIVTRLSMMPFRHDCVVNDEDGSDRWVRASLAERFLCLGQRYAHELFISFTIHCIDTRIVVLASRGNVVYDLSCHSLVIGTLM
jgi:hypothetical protein